MFSLASVIVFTRGVCIAKGGCAWQREHLIQRRGMHGEEACVSKGDVHGDGGMCGKGGHAW